MLEATPFKEFYSDLHHLRALDASEYQSGKLQADRVFAVELRRERIRGILRTQP
jgi:hypothetical protein